MSKEKLRLKGVVAQSDLPRWVKPIGVNDGWSKFSIFWAVGEEMIEEYVFAYMGMGLVRVACAWHLKEAVDGTRCMLVPGNTTPPLVMITAGIAGLALDVERFARRADRDAEQR